MQGNSPRVDRRVILLEPVYVDADSWGGRPEPTWVEHPVWAARHDVPSSGRGGDDTTGARIGRNADLLETVFVIRYRDDISTDWRIREGLEEWAVVGVRQLDRRRWIEARATKGIR